MPNRIVRNINMKTWNNPQSVFVNNLGLSIEYKLAINNFYDFELLNGGAEMKENMVEENDWRLLRGQDEYLRNKKFHIKNLKNCERNGIMNIANFVGTNLWKTQMG